MIGTNTRRRISEARASRSTMERVRQGATLAVLTIGAIIMILPFEWMLATSLSKAANVGLPRTPRFWPPDPSLFNYELAADNLPLIQYYMNTIIVVGTTTIAFLFFSS